jgi:hypothetical protein
VTNGVASSGPRYVQKLKSSVSRGQHFMLVLLGDSGADQRSTAESPGWLRSTRSLHHGKLRENEGSCMTMKGMPSQLLLWTFNLRHQAA